MSETYRKDATVLFSRSKTTLPTPEEALPGHPERIYSVPTTHAVLGTPLEGPYPEGMQTLVLGLGCFWGAEEIYWRIPGVYTTSAGYAGGISPNPTYEEVCTGRTAHAEVVKVVYDPAKVSTADLLKVFWESHDPTQGYRQGNDLGSQYRSAVYFTTDEQREVAEAQRAVYQDVIRPRGYGDITTEIAPLGDYYPAEDYHQQYLYKVPHGYRCHANTGVELPV
ncbi:MAG TPA: peptide-methionine (S)-S-oxide reductase MsrA [Motilibacteraceae bacterium]|nr:peptide-methionine (S)-S-oxide reductase MsrA [Motilibacteraceae bacterium]